MMVFQKQSLSQDILNLDTSTNIQWGKTQVAEYQEIFSKQKEALNQWKTVYL